MKLFVILIFLSGLIYPTQAQIRISGIFIDMDGNPIAYTSISLESSTQEIINSVTDSRGKYEITIQSGTYHLTVNFFGTVIFKHTYTFDSNTDLGTLKIDNSHQLQEILITAQRKIIEPKADRLIYNVENDPFSKNLEVMDVLKKVPFVSIKNEDQIGIVGKDNVQYMIDGKIIELSEEAIKMRLKTLRSENIAKIEIITTPPSKYSAGGNSGFINIITKKDATLGFKSDLYGNIRRNDKTSLGGGASFNYSISRLETSLGINANHFYAVNELTRLFEFIHQDQFSHKTTYLKGNFYNVHAIVKYKLSPLLEIGITFNQLENPSSTSGSDQTIYSSTSNEIGTADSTVSTQISEPKNREHTTSFSAYMDYKIDTLGKILSFTYNYYGKNAHSESQINSLVKKNVSNGDYSLLTLGKNKYHIHSWKLDGTFPLSLFNAETGAAYTRINNNSDIRFITYFANQPEMKLKENDHFLYSEDTWALYLSIQKNFKNNWFVKGGVRYEYTTLKGLSLSNQSDHTSHYGYFFPTAYLGWKSNQNHSLSFSYSMRINRPGFRELNPFRYYTSVYNYTSGNAYLLPSLFHNLELIYSNGGNFTSTLYIQRLHKGIDYVTLFDEAGRQSTLPENHYNQNKIGLYLSYRLPLFSWWNIMLNGDFFYSKQNSYKPELQIENIQGYGGSVNIQSDWTLDRKKNWFFHIGYMHFMPKYENMSYYKSMQLLDINLRFSTLGGKLRLMLRLNDPFNQSNTRQERTYANYKYKSRFDTHQRNLSLTISYMFGGEKIKAVSRDSKDTESYRGNT